MHLLMLVAIAIKMFNIWILSIYLIVPILSYAITSIFSPGLLRVCLHSRTTLLNYQLSIYP